MLLAKPVLLALAAVMSVPAVAQRSFAGTWKLNQHESRFVGASFTIQRTAKGYRFDFGATSYEVGDDGQDYPTIPSRTTSIKPTGERAWFRVHKVNGREMDRSTVTLSADGTTMTIHTIATDDKGEQHTSDESLHRVGAGQGLAGTWQSDAADVHVAGTYVIEERGNKLRWQSADEGQSFTATPDGPPAPLEGSRSVPGITVRMRRSSALELHLTTQINGKTYSESDDLLSPDGRHLTEISWLVQRPAEKQIAVYDRQ